MSGKGPERADEDQLLKRSAHMRGILQLCSLGRVGFAGDSFPLLTRSPWVVVGEKPGRESIIKGDLLTNWMLTLCITLLNEIVS